MSAAWQHICRTGCGRSPVDVHDPPDDLAEPVGLDVLHPHRRHVDEGHRGKAADLIALLALQHGRNKSGSAHCGRGRWPAAACPTFFTTRWRLWRPPGGPASTAAREARGVGAPLGPCSSREIVDELKHACPGQQQQKQRSCGGRTSLSSSWSDPRFRLAVGLEPPSLTSDGDLRGILRVS